MLIKRQKNNGGGGGGCGGGGLHSLWLGGHDEGVAVALHGGGPVLGEWHGRRGRQRGGGGEGGLPGGERWLRCLSGGHQAVLLVLLVLHLERVAVVLLHLDGAVEGFLKAKVQRQGLSGVG